VDDLLALSGATSATQILREISLHIRINIKGVPNHFIGQDLVITDDSITLSQHNYAQSIEVEHADSVIQNPLPLDVLRDEDTSAYLSKEDITTYKSLLGKFAFLTHTMPNIAYAYSYFGTYASKPTHKAYRLLYRACQYVKQNSDKCLIYKVRQTNGFHVQAWCDASLGSYTHDSQTGYIITLNGSPILWRSVVQKRARHSSTEAECSAMHDCLDKLILCMYFISELHVKVHSTVYSDSLDLIKLLQADHPRPTARHMLIELREMQDKFNLSDKAVKRLVQPLLALHDCLHYFESSPIRLVHTPGIDNPADCLTKPADLSPLMSRFLHKLHSL
jgi:hypothetical protein